MTDIFTALIEIISICALAAVTAIILFSPAKIWDEANRTSGQIKEFFIMPKCETENRTSGLINQLSSVERVAEKNRILEI